MAYAFFQPSTVAEKRAGNPRARSLPPESKSVGHPAACFAPPVLRPVFQQRFDPADEIDADEVLGPPQAVGARQHHQPVAVLFPQQHLFPFPAPVRRRAVLVLEHLQNFGAGSVGQNFKVERMAGLAVKNQAHFFKCRAAAGGIVVTQREHVVLDTFAKIVVEPPVEPIEIRQVARQPSGALKPQVHYPPAGHGRSAQLLSEPIAGGLVKRRLAPQAEKGESFEPRLTVRRSGSRLRVLAAAGHRKAQSQQAQSDAQHPIWFSKKGQAGPDHVVPPLPGSLR
ncbi:MAG: hypothetical protein DRQ39_09485 [Gammaproteobacteria bacterium]|nr:MAG: hypothetical protein DRQ39_09485 [Gammaproteobacteria bacterium]